ncbi:MAG TPA: hypothetical protein VGN73_09210 [Gemmatimonadaceae bacterium]|jgi:hypothetical protein|nr:hypothetical protein [Gemmatimonadaceae bacterium]
MVQYIPRLNATLALSFALFVGACAKTDTNTAAADSALNKDIQLANRDTAAQPALTDVPASSTAPAPVAVAPKPTTSRPSTSTSRPTSRPSTSTSGASRPTTSVTASGNTVTRTAAGSGRQVGTIPAGSTLNLASNDRICTNTNKVGQRFNATVTNAITGSNGAVIPEGATATVEVTELKRSENVNDNVVMGFRVVAVSFGGHTYPVSATTSYAQVDRVKNQPKSKDVQKVAGGAAIGAIAGQILGKSTKSTIIGGAIGAAAGAGAAATTSNYEGCVSSGGKITATLNSSTQVQI